MSIVTGLGETYSPQIEPQLTTQLDKDGKPTRALLKRIYRGLSKTQYAFILTQVEHDVSSEYTDVEGDSYGYHLKVTSYKAFNDSGAGTRVVFYRTSKSQELVKMVFYASAVVESIEALSDDRFKAVFSNYVLFDQPIAKSDVEIHGWNAQNAMEEIDANTFLALLTNGFHGTTKSLVPGISQAEPSKIPTVLAKESVEKVPASPYAELVVPRVTWEPIPTGKVNLEHISQVTMPNVILRDENASDVVARFSSPTNYGSQVTNKFAEKRAIHVVKTYFDMFGWTLKRDRQLDGCGYDLEYLKEGQELHVEVKGIKGDAIAFNLTELEWQRVLDDECFIIAAVTGVLNSETENLSFLNRAQIAAARRKILQYRISLEQ